MNQIAVLGIDYTADPNLGHGILTVDVFEDGRIFRYTVSGEAEKHERTVEEIHTASNGMVTPPQATRLDDIDREYAAQLVPIIQAMRIEQAVVVGKTLT